MPQGRPTWKFCSRFVPIVTLLAFGTACSDTPSQPESLEGRLAYLASDTAGDPLLVGTLVLEVDSDSAIAGQWSIDWMQGADTTTVVGPQLGSGRLVGSVEGGRVFVDLTPDFADNNVFLVADLMDGWLVGSWFFSGFAGPVSSGPFVARRL